MNNGLETRYFLSALTGAGYYALHRQFLRPPERYFCILKGGPGCGKSTFLTRGGDAGRAAGLAVVRLHCAGDPASLDGVYFPEKRSGFFDGTAPHTVDPALFGASGEYLDLGTFCRTEALDTARKRLVFEELFVLSTAMARIRSQRRAEGGIRMKAADLETFYRTLPFSPTGAQRRAVAAARGRDPLEVALDRTVPHARLVATQVKYLARAAQKLPSYAAAQCILPPLAFEQASSEACAAHKLLEGDTVLDLTCGLGAAALFLSRRFRRVVTLERNEMLARVAAENFSRMGVANVDVVNASAEEYLRRDGLRFDWIYADPDRRSDKGRKLVRLEDCSPDIVALKPRLKQVSGRLCVKNSPLFDVGEALRLFPDSRVEVLSLGDECKEVVVYDDGTGPLVTATALGRGSFSAAPGETAPPPGRFDPERYGYLVIPDVSLQKARLARIHLAGKADIWSDNGYGFAVEEPEGVLGRTFAVESIEPYDPKRLKRELKGRGAEVLKRDFPLAAEELMRRLGLHAGAGLRLAFTKIGNDFWVIRLK